MKYYMLTINRNNVLRTVAFSSDICKSPANFLITELALGRNTFILNVLEITKDEYLAIEKYL